MNARPRPSYLRVVPPAGKRFRRPRKVSPPAPLARQGDDVAAMIRQAERLEAIILRLHLAVIQADEIAAKALADRASIEAQYAAMLARSLREGTSCA